MCRTALPSPFGILPPLIFFNKILYAKGQVFKSLAIRELDLQLIPCAIPYMIRTMPDPSQNIMGNKPLENAGVEIVVDKAVSLDTAANKLTLGSGKEAG
jgi:hypothetical protein